MGPMQPGPQQIETPPGPQVNGDIQQILDALGITAEDLDAMFQSGTFDESNALGREQAGMAAGMMNAPLPEGRQVGRVYTAANPLEMAAATMGKMKGMRDYDDSAKERKTLIEMLRRGTKAGGLLAMRDRYGDLGDSGPELLNWQE